MLDLACAVEYLEDTVEDLVGDCEVTPLAPRTVPQTHVTMICEAEVAAEVATQDPENYDWTKIFG